MKNRKHLILYILIAFTGIINSSKSQDTLTPIRFISPVEIPISLAGNFGEIRPGHFHAGLDIRTQGKEGLMVRSIAEGYVSRVAISLYGYGKVVYVSHPNGYTSVYAHLQRFYPELEKWVKDYQYANKTFELDVEFTTREFSLEQGERVGWSGNTGGSAGPHLHFEIRNTLTERPLNPLRFGIPVSDRISPTLHYLGVYPLNESSAVDGRCQHKTYKVEKSGSTYRLAGGTVPRVKGKIGFGLEARDKTNGSPFRCGIYSLSLTKDGKEVFSHQLDSFSFDHTRSINAHVDYYEWKKNKRRVQRSWLLEGNALEIYGTAVNRGQLFFLDSGYHELSYTVSDFMGNASKLNFKVKSDPGNHLIPERIAPVQVLKYNQVNEYRSDKLILTFPATCLYENTELRLEVKNAVGRCITPRYVVNSLYEPLNDYMTIGINVSHIAPEKREKLVVVSLDAKSQILAAEGGEIDSNWIKAQTRSFGPYTVMLDTTPPEVRPLQNIAGLTYRGSEKIRFAVKDDISGIEEYYALLDDQWVLVEYERNKKTAFLQLDHTKPSGTKRTLTLVFRDAVGNTSEKEYEVIY